MIKYRLAKKKGESAMKIAMTKKLVDAVGVSAPAAPVNDQPIFSWTANWTTVWSNHRTEDLLVLVNHATRFTVAIYQVKKKDLKKLEEMVKKAIANALLFININPEVVEEYMRAVLQRVFAWKDYHLYDFAIHAGEKDQPVARIVPDAQCLEYDEKAVLMEGHALEEYLPAYSQILYTYDLGDDWEHDIQLVQVLEDYDKESPCLVEASGQTPPEDVGGVGGFVKFRSIMLNPGHPEYEAMRTWAGYWTPELSDWAQRPRVIHCLT